MTWVRLDDQWSDHPKLLSVSELAQLLWIKGLTYASRYLTDGHIPDAALRLLMRRKRRILKLVGELVSEGLWQRRDGGYQIHDYADYQPSSAKVKAERAATRDRVKRFRERAGNGVTPDVGNAVTTEDGNGVTPDVGNGVVTESVTRIPRARARIPVSGEEEKKKREEPTGPVTPAWAAEHVAAIVARLRHHDPIFRSLPVERIALQHASFMVSAGQSLELVLKAIDECAVKMPEAITTEAAQAKLVGFMRHKRWDRANGSNGSAPTDADKPKNYESTTYTKEEIAAQQERARRKSEGQQRQFAEVQAREAAMRGATPK